MDKPDPNVDAILSSLADELADALEDIGTWKMPFGKYGPQACPPDGVPLYDLPVEYLLWFKQKGFPKGRLGKLLSVVCQIKVDGAEVIFQPMREAAGGRHPLKVPRQKEWTFENDDEES
jgi:uncharacterized protein